MLANRICVRYENTRAFDDGEGMEFCWKLNYIQLNDTFSEVHPTESFRI